MSKLILKELREKKEWDPCLTQAGFDTLFLSRDFSRLYADDPVLLVCRKGRDAAAFVYSREKNVIKGLRYGGVITNSLNRTFCSDVADSLTDYLHAQGVAGCRIRNHPFLRTIPVGQLIKEEPFVFIDLRRPFTELESAITKQHRRCIRKAQESNLCVAYADDIKCLKVFYPLYKELHEKLGVQPKPYAFFEQMFRFLKEHLAFSIVKEGDRILAVSLLWKDLGDIFLTYGGMSDEGYGRHAKHLMIFDLINKFKSEGSFRLVLGTGNNGKDSIYKFKRGFTDTEHCISTYGI